MTGTVTIVLNPKPKAVSLPTPVYVDSRMVGHLISYDSQSGSGKAEIDVDIEASALPKLCIVFNEVIYGFKTLHV